MSPLIGFRDVSVAYPGTLALDGVTLAIEPGDVLAVVGANGSGKTTLLNTLCGMRSATQGTLVGPDGPVRFTQPAQALRRGIALVPQEPQLAESLSLWENLVVGRNGLLGPAFRRRQRDEASRQITEALPGQDPAAPASSLRKADRAIVGLLRMLVRRPSVLALDEPTAVLGENSVAVVASATRRVCDGGGAVVLVSHRLRDIVQLASRVAVLVDGRLVYQAPMSEVSVDDLVERLSSGRSQPVSAPPRARSASTLPGRDGDAVLDVCGLATRTGLAIDSLTVRRGEIVGLAGLSGSGRSRTCRAVTACESATGRITVSGRELPRSPAAARRLGIAYIPEDRAREAIFPALSVSRNLEVGALAGGRLSRPLRPVPSAQRTRELMARFGVKAPSPAAFITALSGGNQQRVVLARVLSREPRLLVADEPTQGVDQVGRAAIHQMIREFAAAGGAVLLVASEFEELQALAGRICVMRDGKIVAEVQSDTDYRELIGLATGAREVRLPEGELE